jgi:hypothetical protein
LIATATCRAWSHWPPQPSYDDQAIVLNFAVTASDGSLACDSASLSSPPPTPTPIVRALPHVPSGCEAGV